MSTTDHRLTRRQTLGAFGLTSAGLLLGGAGASGGAALDASAAAAACTLTPEQEEGPYYVALEKIRKNVVAGRPGVPLHLNITVIDPATCKPIPNAAVDIWQCDATGVYSDESVENTVGQTWLRGVQLTNAKGVAAFITIYPGFYQGRATHIHTKVHVGGTAKGAKYSAGHVAHTGQLFFPDAMSTKVYKLAPYTSDHQGRTLHSADRVWTQQHGASVLLTLKQRGSSLANSGLTAAVTLGVKPGATPSAVGV